MRLWHKDLIPVLPRQQLVSQWRECCAIAKNISTNGTPNHILVNKIMQYPLTDFYAYTNLVITEMKKRGYTVSTLAVNNFKKHLPDFNVNNNILKNYQIFIGWHENRYLTQCFYNLQEKYDCGGITQSEWEKINSLYYKINWIDA